MVMLWQDNIGWGCGSTFGTAASAGMRHDPGGEAYTLLQRIMAATSQTLRTGHAFDLDDYIGGQGRQGPAGPRGLPGLPGWGTDYVPYTYVPSTPAPATPRRPYHPNDKPDESYSNILTLWSQVATAIVYAGSDVDCTGWAKFVNETGNDRVLGIWLMYRSYVQGDPAGLADDGYGPANATRISDVVTGTIPFGQERTIRVRGSLTSSAYGYIDLYVQIDAYSGEDVRAVANHYGISGKGVFPRT